MVRPLVFIHGYSATGDAFDLVRDALRAEYERRGLQLPLADINICTYISLNNEVTIPDIAEGLDRALRELPMFKDERQEFDAIVHSTGMLVIRAWLVNKGALASENPRLKRLKHLVGLAPATWGSPQAAQGRTWLGALIKGPKNFGPDFLNAGDRVLEGLELGSSFTWDLAHWDLLGPQPYYDPTDNTPFVSVFIGNKGYDGVASFADSPGSDGTVRWSGCALTTRKITLDLTRVPSPGTEENTRVSINPKQGSIEIPMIAVDNRCHSTLLSDPDPGMIGLIADFLQVAAPVAGGPAPAVSDYDAWLARALEYGKKGLAQMLADPAKRLGIVGEVEQAVGYLDAHPVQSLDGWQQFVVHVVDAHGKGVDDFFLEIVSFDAAGKAKQLQGAFDDVHAYGPDNSFRSFHVMLPMGVSRGVPSLIVRLHASTGTDIVCYQGYGDPLPPYLQQASPDSGGGAAADESAVKLTAGAAPVELDISSLAAEAGAFFAPFRTTLVEIQLNREPLPLTGANKVLFFLPQPQ